MMRAVPSSSSNPSNFSSPPESIRIESAYRSVSLILHSLVLLSMCDRTALACGKVALQDGHVSWR